MNKKLIFSFYISRDTYNLEINEIHFKCLEKYANVFDRADITFIMKDRADTELLLDAEIRFSRMFLGRDIQFSVIDNDEFRESRVFYDKIASKLSENDIVFFGHNKGVSNVSKYDTKQIYSWVCGMYYYNLNFIEEVEQKLVNSKFFSYGTFLTQNEEPEKYTKYGWYYIGTFFWINCQKLWQYMLNEEIAVPALSDRFYDEEFLGNIIPSWPMMTAASHGNLFLKSCYNYYEHATDYLGLIYNTKEDGFDAFYEEVVGQ